MTALSTVRDLYLHIDEWLAKNPNDIEKITLGKRTMNACAYYVLLFAQFEQMINRSFEQAVGPVGETAFLYRIELLDSLFNFDLAARIMDYYEVRNKVAHGQSVAALPFGIGEAFEFFSEVAEVLGSR